MTQDEIVKMAREAGFDPHDMSDDFTCNLMDIKRFAALVAAAEREKREWVGLTDEEKIELWNKHENHWRFEDNLMAFTRAIEAKLKEKNT